MRGNNVSGAPYTKSRMNRWRALEALPVEIRMALCDSVIQWCPAQCLRGYQKFLRAYPGLVDEAVSFVLRVLRRAESDEILDFSRDWPCRLGPYPHVAAKATIQRYGFHGHRSGGGPVPMDRSAAVASPKHAAAPRARVSAVRDPGSPCGIADGASIGPGLPQDPIPGRRGKSPPAPCAPNSPGRPGSARRRGLLA